jgi:hypothetical protein
VIEFLAGRSEEENVLAVEAIKHLRGSKPYRMLCARSGCQCLGRGFCVKCQRAQNGVEEPDVTEVLKRDDLKYSAQETRRAAARITDVKRPSNGDSQKLSMLTAQLSP